MADNDPKTPPSASIYTPIVLRIYDALVLSFSNAYVWTCSTKKVLLPFFRKHLANSANHLDVGVGTGYYLTNSQDLLRDKNKVVLMDLSPHTLALVTDRLRQGAGLKQVESVLHDATKPWDRPADLPKFSSISFFYVFHCMAGRSITEKVDAVCSSLNHHLEPEEGVFYGATVLGAEANHNIIGRLFLWQYNRNGYFGNMNDKESDLRDALQRHFQEVEVVREGRVALFMAKRRILEQ